MTGRKKVTIVGGGQTGGIMAYRLAEKNICDIVIKDVAEFAQHHGKALDIYQGSSFAGFESRLTATDDWDATTGGWLRSQNGQAHVMADTKARIAPKNVVVQLAPYTASPFVDVTGSRSPEAQLVGTGEVWVFTDGKVVKGTWSRPARDQVTTYKDASVQPIALTPGQTFVELVPADLIGTPANAAWLHAFDAADEINIVAIPDLVNPTFGEPPSQAARDAILAAMTYCENRKDCFFVADTAKGLTPTQALGYKQGQAPSPATGNALNSKFAAIYYPWIFVTDPLNAPTAVPPRMPVITPAASSGPMPGMSPVTAAPVMAPNAAPAAAPVAAPLSAWVSTFSATTRLP